MLFYLFHSYLRVLRNCMFDKLHPMINSSLSKFSDTIQVLAGLEAPQRWVTKEQGLPASQKTPGGKQGTYICWVPR